MRQCSVHSCSCPCSIGILNFVSIILDEKRPRDFWTKIGDSGYSAVMPTEFHDFFSQDESGLDFALTEYPGCQGAMVGISYFRPKMMWCFRLLNLMKMH